MFDRDKLISALLTILIKDFEFVVVVLVIMGSSDHSWFYRGVLSSKVRFLCQPDLTGLVKFRIKDLP